MGGDTIRPARRLTGSVAGVLLPPPCFPGMAHPCKPFSAINPGEPRGIISPDSAQAIVIQTVHSHDVSTWQGVHRTWSRLSRLLPGPTLALGSQPFALTTLTALTAMTRPSRSAGSRPPQRARPSLPVALAAFLFIAAAGLQAQVVPLSIPMDPPAGLEGYLDGVPGPREVIGHTIGETFTSIHQVADYLRAVGESSDRVVVGRHATSHQGRPLLHAIVTSPANHARLDEIRETNLRLSDAPHEVSDADLEEMPLVIYMGYSVHGNEASGTEAALLLLHHLAAGTGPGVERVLDEAVVIIDPSLNPDGRDRFVNWVNDNRGRVATSDPGDREHNEPWPGGRGNHYMFDLNRQWWPAQHPESQGRLDLWHAWRPQLHSDYHEFGFNATYFFEPGIPTRENPHKPEGTLELTRRLAPYLARSLDELGSLYFTEETFDDWYLGLSGTYPDLQGSVGILTEQAHSRGYLRETQWGVMSYPFTIRNHFATSLGMLAGALDMRTDFLANQRDTFREAPDYAAAGPTRGWVIRLDQDRTRAQALGQLLLRHRIELYELAGPTEVDGTTIGRGGGYLVPVDQPQARLVRTVMEPMTTFPDSLFYSVSGWTAPLAFGVGYGELTGGVGELLGDRITRMPLDGGAVVGGEARFAYIMEWDRYLAPRAVYRLLEAGVIPRVSPAPFEIEVEGERTRFDRGSIVVPVVQRDVEARLTPEELHALVNMSAREDHVVFHAVHTGLAPEGPDLGSSATGSALRKPRIAILSGSGTNSVAVGEAWHLLDHQMEIPVSLLDVERVAGTDLSRYNTIVMTGYSSGLSGAAADALESWIRRGGVLIAADQSVNWVVQRELIPDELRSTPVDASGVPYEDLAAFRGAQRIGGAVVEVEIDRSHPLAFGYGERAPVLRSHERFLEPAGSAGSVVATYVENPRLTGYISDRRAEELAGTGAVVAHRVGGGQVIVLMDNPNQWSYFRSTNRFFLNAVFFGHIL